MTEEEAKQKWCPFARVVGVELKTDGGFGTNATAAFNRGDVSRREIVLPSAARCVAAQCMAWRWDNAGIDFPTHGHCGLAGRPA